MKEQLGLDVDISEKIKPHQWEKLPWRWVVERTLSWLNHSRRLSKDYEISVSSAETMVIISHSHTLLKRLRIQLLTGVWGEIVSKHYAKGDYHGRIGQKATKERKYDGIYFRD